MILVLVGHFDCKHRCHVEKIVTIAFILSSRWQDGESSIRMESNNLTETLAPFVVRQNYFCLEDEINFQGFLIRRISEAGNLKLNYFRKLTFGNRIQLSNIVKCIFGIFVVIGGGED